jgi:hypothetical protein
MSIISRITVKEIEVLILKNFTLKSNPKMNSNVAEADENLF